MTEHISWNKTPALEAEIAELTRQIEDKRKQLEVESGIISDREIVASAIAENFTAQAAEQAATTEHSGAPTVQVVSPTDSDYPTYLDSLDETSVATLNSLIAMVPEEGVGKAIAAAATHGPFILDAFHDALVDKLYSELEERGLVN